MKHFGDHDGKSKTSSAVDAEHYLDVDGQHHTLDVADDPSHADISALAYELWEQNGRPSHSHEEDWLEARRRLLTERKNAGQARVLAAQAGSVQR